MKKILQRAALALLSFFILLPSALLGQGSLTPPGGAPAPTMKSLDQIEPRTAITNAASLVTISKTGSYYLTRNLTVSSGDAIDINTNGVTLDLNGFTISSTAASANGNAILLNGNLLNITIVNGFIQSGVTNNGSGVYNGGGFGYGIYCTGGQPVNVLASKIGVVGCLYSGIYLSLGSSVVVDLCTVRTAGNYGIWANVVKQCSALDCGQAAVAGYTISDSYGQSVTGQGIFAIDAINCTGYSSSNDGVYANTVQNCYGVSTTGKGIECYTAENCWGECDGNGSYGIDSDITANCFGILYNSTGHTGYGIAGSVATGCVGYVNYGTGISETIATGCHGTAAVSGTSLAITHNLNSF